MDLIIAEEVLLIWEMTEMTVVNKKVDPKLHS